jgi:hypothetical protein
VDNISVIHVTVGEKVSTDTLVDSQPRGQFPTDVDWESVDTQPLRDLNKRRRWSLGALTDYLGTLQKNNIMLLTALLFICAFAFGTLWIGTRLFKPGEDSNNLLLETTLAVQTPGESAVDRSLSPIQSSSPQLNTDPTVIVASTDIPTAVGSTPALTETEVTLSPSEKFCVVKTEVDILSDILWDEFEIVYDQTSPYYYYTFCEPIIQDELWECSEKILIPDHDQIPEDWWVVIPTSAENLDQLCGGSVRGEFAIEK